MPDERVVRRILFPLSAAVILSYYLFFTWRSVHLYFDQDDMMNLYFAWSKPLSEVVRPLGGLFYRAFFAAFGFNPLPFRIACLIIGALNICLCFRFANLIVKSGRIAALTVLFFAFQTRLMEVWFRTAVIYDLLCFTFLYAAACLYMGARKVSVGRSAVIIVCYVCALSSKEAAVALPVILLAWDALFARIRPLPFLLGLITVPFIAGKTMGPGAMTNNPFYKPEYSFGRFAHSWSVFLNYLFVLTDQITPTGAIAILIALLAIALALRSRELIFCWILLFVSTLPVVFLEYRGGFVLYISYVGWCLYAAILLVRLQDLIGVKDRTALACVVFTIAMWRYGKLQLHDQRADPRAWLYDPPRMVHSLADQMRALHPRLPHGARILFADDEFSTDEFTPLFIMKLLYHDDTLTVDRVKKMSGNPTGWIGYDYVFNYEKGRYSQLKPPR